MSHRGARRDETFMRRALELAARGLGRTSPNPAVGAVVAVGDEMVGEGWHHRAGEEHAEPLAIQAAGARAEGATIYVSLEPCCHYGRTPPCTDAIVAAGIRRVVYACGDCDERCSGEGARALEAAGIEVACGPLSQEAMRLNEAYLKHKGTGLPFVTLKLACSLDGKIATRCGDSRWISGDEARAFVHRLRDRNDAVMVGIGTVLADDPRLTTRLADGSGRDAVRVIADSRARTPVAARVVDGDSEAGCIVVVGEGAREAGGEARVGALRAAGVEVVEAPGDSGVDLAGLMAELGRRDIMSVLIEGGGTLAAGALEAGVVDRLLLFYAPKLIGGERARTVMGGMGVARVAEATGAEITDVRMIGADVLVEATLCSRA